MASEALSEFDLCSIVQTMFGHDCALSISQRFGGTEINIPVKYSKAHDLCAHLSERDASLLCQEHGSSSIIYYVSRKLAKRHRIRQVLELRRQRVTARKIAYLSGFSERQVYRILQTAGLRLSKVAKP